MAINTNIIMESALLARSAHLPSHGQAYTIRSCLL